ncbi:hypothetical protein Q5762_19850 [Streptomyces sp. P9(2023)]|uniref:hypothetical protein n=1 Tax=Streptomyces sp. P9(2023) TaxID=3064394 RepID=UPI0028F41279|nr:hypothetical protein [Streptomyces sp. P9(2023)]MDT9690555.1 hypothetical protein [Streptomyces sp. P9(2023)]
MLHERAATHRRLAAAGASGFLTRSGSDEKPELRWTRYADGSSTALSTDSNYRVDNIGSDVVAIGDEGAPAARKQIGGGWNTYSHLVGIGDGNKDGRPDLYVSGPADSSYFYAGTGDRLAPFATRTPTEVLLGGTYPHIL